MLPTHKIFTRRKQKKMKKIHEISHVYMLEKLPEIVDELYALKEKCRVYTLTGDLGAGKTTLVKALLKKFGVHEPVTSPTFSYVNTYTTANQKKLHHFDLYRLSNLDEFLHVGFDELLHENNSWSFVEWPEIIEPLVQHGVCKIALEHDSRNLGQRIIRYCVYV